MCIKLEISSNTGIIFHIWVRLYLSDAWDAPMLGYTCIVTCRRLVYVSSFVNMFLRKGLRLMRYRQSVCWLVWCVCVIRFLRVSVADTTGSRRTLLTKSINHARSVTVKVHTDGWTRMFTALGLPWWSPVQVLTEIDVPYVVFTRADCPTDSPSDSP
jgi:hypothetical protein